MFDICRSMQFVAGCVNLLRSSVPICYLLESVRLSPIMFQDWFLYLSSQPFEEGLPACAFRTWSAQSKIHRLKSSWLLLTSSSQHVPTTLAAHLPLWEHKMPWACVFFKSFARVQLFCMVWCEPRQHGKRQIQGGNREREGAVIQVLPEQWMSHYNYISVLQLGCA